MQRERAQATESTRVQDLTSAPRLEAPPELLAVLSKPSLIPHAEPYNSAATVVHTNVKEYRPRVLSSRCPRLLPGMR